MVLEAIYSGKFYLCETVVPTSPEYRKVVKICETLMNQLYQRLIQEGAVLEKMLPEVQAVRPTYESDASQKAKQAPDPQYSPVRWMEAQGQVHRLLREDTEERKTRLLARQRQWARQAKDAPLPQKKRADRER